MGARKERRKRLIREGRCVECAKPCDRLPRTLCSICAPIFAKVVGEYHARLKKEAFEHYGGASCSCCKETQIIMLNIHHLNDDGAKHRKELRNGKGESGGGGLKIYLWLKRNNYPQGFGVLCFNCNHATHVLGYCPHER